MDMAPDQTGHCAGAVGIDGQGMLKGINGFLIFFLAIHGPPQKVVGHERVRCLSNGRFEGFQIKFAFRFEGGEVVKSFQRPAHRVEP